MNDFLLFSLIGAMVLGPAVAAYVVGIRVGRRRAAWGDHTWATPFPEVTDTSTLGYPSGFMRTATGPADDEAPEGFRPTKVMSYADAMNATPGQRDSTPTLRRPDPAVSLPAAAPARHNWRDVDARIRIRLLASIGASLSASVTSFETIDVVGISLEGGLPMVHARFNAPSAAAHGKPGVVRIPAARIVGAVDLVGRARVDDVWLWLEARAASTVTPCVPSVDVAPVSTGLPAKYALRTDTVTT